MSEILKAILTNLRTSLVAIAMMSAQETIPGHCSSTAAFKASISS